MTHVCSQPQVSCWSCNCHWLTKTQSCVHLQVFQSCALVRDTVGLSNSGISSAVAKVCLPLIVTCVKASITLLSCFYNTLQDMHRKQGIYGTPAMA